MFSLTGVRLIQPRSRGRLFTPLFSVACILLKLRALLLRRQERSVK